MARFRNDLDVPMTNFKLQAAVPKYVRLTIHPATGEVLPPHMDVVTQTMTCANATNGEKSLLMKLRVEYVLNGQPVLEQAQVGGFPAGY
mmetsp:Transcript_3499/g.10020  ORF Transcript_3499/g.10020 Transcript_3499/m.10020 type:complete len:89 (+) Transcript_3499:419-685(+)